MRKWEYTNRTNSNPEILNKMDADGWEFLFYRNDGWGSTFRRLIVREDRNEITVNTNITIPLSRVVTEGTIGDCKNCKSTIKKRFIFFGIVIGCINKECELYYRKYQDLVK